MIPLNSGLSIWCVTVNSTHGNYEHPRSATPPVTVSPSCACVPTAVRERRQQRDFPLVYPFPVLALLNFIFNLKFNFLCNLCSLLIICYSAILFCISYSMNIYTSANAYTRVRSHRLSKLEARRDANVSGCSRTHESRFHVNHHQFSLNYFLSSSFTALLRQVRTAPRRGLLSVSVEMACATRPN